MSKAPIVHLRPPKWDDLRADEAEREIKRRLKVSSPIVTDHANERMSEREEMGCLNSVDMFRILETGSVMSKPEKVRNGWKVVLQKRMPGSRDAGVVTVIVPPPSDDLIVVTVEWMDWKS